MPFTVLRTDRNGEVIEVAATDSLEAAEKLIQSLKRLWPAEYSVQESKPPEGESGKAKYVPFCSKAFTASVMCAVD
jgi:hypothetical protein